MSGSSARNAASSPSTEEIDQEDVTAMARRGFEDDHIPVKLKITWWNWKQQTLDGVLTTVELAKRPKAASEIFKKYDTFCRRRLPVTLPGKHGRHSFLEDTSCGDETATTQNLAKSILPSTSDETHAVDIISNPLCMMEGSCVCGAPLPDISEVYCQSCWVYFTVAVKASEIESLMEVHSVERWTLDTDLQSTIENHFSSIEAPEAPTCMTLLAPETSLPAAFALNSNAASYEDNVQDLVHIDSVDLSIGSSIASQRRPALPDVFDMNLYDALRSELAGMNDTDSASMASRSLNSLTPLEHTPSLHSIVGLTAGDVSQPSYQTLISQDKPNSKKRKLSAIDMTDTNLARHVYQMPTPKDTPRPKRSKSTEQRLQLECRNCKRTFPVNLKKNDGIHCTQCCNKMKMRSALEAHASTLDNNHWASPPTASPSSPELMNNSVDPRALTLDFNA